MAVIISRRSSYCPNFATAPQASATGSLAYGLIGDDVWVATALTDGDAYDNTADAIQGINQIEEERERPRKAASLKAWHLGDPIPFLLKRRDG